jgi:hypothetical protein
LARVKLIQNKEDVAPEHYELFDELAALRSRISGPSTVILHAPASGTRRVPPPRQHRRGPPRRARRRRHARECDGPYVWNAHAGAARRNGAAGPALDAVANRTALDGLPEDEALVIRFVRGLLQNNRVDQDVFDALLAAHDPRWLVELTCWVGRYGALSGVLNPRSRPQPEPEPLLP